MKVETEEQISDLLLWRDAEAHNLLVEVCREHHIKLEVVAELLAWERKVQRKGDKYGGMNQQLDKIFAEESLWEEQDVD